MQLQHQADFWCLAGWGLAARVWGSVHLLLPPVAQAAAASYSHYSPAAATGITSGRPLHHAWQAAS